MNLYKKISFIILVIVLIFFSKTLTINADQPEFDLNARSALLMEAETGNILFEKNPHQQLPPASMTKIMTLLLVMEAMDEGVISLEDTILCSEYAASMGGSQIWLEPGEEMSLEDLIKAIAIVSANDASVAVAEYLYPTVNSFVEKMNQRADELGLKNTYYYNPTGLPPGDEETQGTFTTAYDLAVLSRELLNYPEVLQWTSTWIDYLRNGESVLNNTNKLVRHYPGADGIKTGYTDQAKFCVTATAERDGLRFISVIMAADDSQTRFDEAAKLLSYGFNSFQNEMIAPQNKEIREIKIINAKNENIKIYPSEDFTFPVKKGEEIDQDPEIILKENIRAPLEKNTVVGKMKINIDDYSKEVDLVVKEEVEQISLLGMILRIIIMMVESLVNLF